MKDEALVENESQAKESLEDTLRRVIREELSGKMISQASEIAEPTKPYRGGEGGGDILLLSSRIAPAELHRVAVAHFTDMVKYVVDVRRRVVGIGGELHADAEHLLLEDGSRQEDLWGANYYPGGGTEGCIEFTALINVRPAHGNLSMEIADEATRRTVREITFELIGKGEDLIP